LRIGEVIAITVKAVIVRAVVIIMADMVSIARAAEVLMVISLRIVLKS